MKLQVKLKTMGQALNRMRSRSKRFFSASVANHFAPCVALARTRDSQPAVQKERWRSKLSIRLFALNAGRPMLALWLCCAISIGIKDGHNLSAMASHINVLSAARSSPHLRSTISTNDWRTVKSSQQNHFFIKLFNSRRRLLSARSVVVGSREHLPYSHISSVILMSSVTSWRRSLTWAPPLNQ